MFVFVVALRLLVPLAIPRFPLPAIVAALVVDAVDQTVFQTFGGEPPNYQSYDKALDVYYLAVAYASTLRNWRDPFAFAVACALWYYRLIGTVTFELTGARWVLLVFPNTFEYFFIAYEAIRVCWDPRRLDKRAVLGLAAGIWVFVKLPQEWWIHVAQLDLTDELAAHPGVWWVLLAAAVAAAIGVTAVRRRLPARDWPPTFDVDAHRPARDVAGPSPAAIRSVPFWSSCAEKTLLLSLILIIFGKVLDVSATDVQIVVSVGVLVVGNAAISQLLARRGTAWSSTLRQFLALAGINAALVFVIDLTVPRADARADPGTSIFLLLLASLIITLYDRYRTMRERRLARGEEQTAVALSA